ncbi:GNAT family N-acetyltransferase [Kushneria phyllosphaerae]|uniref:Putative N-acetyltransferase YafP n=1 Tax=Kushneria phyllosphaerae TaxID=2100822 RepID=A0A2R8CLX7_9GAMM|nr:GNAT family N-acetyltransferase [Kushneria phyllosphaerae]SPJ33784.1 putative N-acetyltransferase YafP [Kushneria phyllosphaerae]
MAATAFCIRDYRTGDADTTLTIFQRAVREVAARDYTPAEIEAWAGHIDRNVWANSLERQFTWIATRGNTPAGFASLTDYGHLDMLFVSPDHQRRGVASALLMTAEQAVRQRGMNRMTTEASLTALPFFKARGFEVVRAQEMKRCGEVLRNFRMEKYLKAVEPGVRPARTGQI